MKLWPSESSRAVETAGGDSWSREDGTVDGMWTT